MTYNYMITTVTIINNNYIVAAYYFQYGQYYTTNLRFTTNSNNSNLFTRLNGASNVPEYKLETRSIACAVILEHNDTI